MTRLRLRFSKRVPLVLSRFRKLAAAGTPWLDTPAVALSERTRDPDEWYEEFRAQIEGLVGARRHFPVFRISHGEFIVMGGYRDNLRARLRRTASRLLGKQKAFKSGDPLYGWEEYTEAELTAVKRDLPALVREMASDGILAIALHPENPGFAPFLEPAFEWFESHSIDLNEGNYFPFYFVYVLLCGPDRLGLLSGRRVLVVTGDTHEKREKITGNLRQFGAADVQFVPCHPTKAMLATIDLSAVAGRVDVALVGAGVGAARVLAQLRPLGAVCIDAGYCLSVIADPSIPRRPYAQPDDDPSFGRAAGIPHGVEGRTSGEP